MEVPTAELRFDDSPTGLFVNDEDCRRYFDALNTVLHGRTDPISLETVEQLIELLRESDDNEMGEVYRLKSFAKCFRDPANPTVHQTKPIKAR